MPRIRTIKPEFFTSETISTLPHRTRLTFVGIWINADDEGRIRDRPRVLKAAVWPLDDDVSADDVAADLDYLDAAGLVIRYTASPRGGGDLVDLIQVTNWIEHQRINRPTPSLFPAPGESPDDGDHCGVHEDSLSTHARLTESSLSAGREGFSERSLSGHGALMDGKGGGRGNGSGNGRGSRAHAHGVSPPRCTRHADLPDDDPGPACVACRSVRLREEREIAEIHASAGIRKRAVR